MPVMVTSTVRPRTAAGIWLPTSRSVLRARAESMTTSLAPVGSTPSTSRNDVTDALAQE